MPITPVSNSGTPERPGLNITIAGFDNVRGCLKIKFDPTIRIGLTHLN